MPPVGFEPTTSAGERPLGPAFLVKLIFLNVRSMEELEMIFFLQGLSHTGADLELWTLDMEELIEDSTNANVRGQKECHRVCSGWLLYLVDCARDVCVTIPKDLLIVSCGLCT
jgi:hypothetical protein